MTLEEKREKNRLRAAAWRSAHPGEQNAYLKAYHLKNRDVQLAKRRKWYDEHKGAVAASRKAERALKPKRANKTAEEHAEVRKAYREANRERLAEANRSYRKAHPEATKAVVNAWRKANRERWYQGAKKWELKNPSYRSHAAARRRADTFRATPAWADIDAIRAIYAEAVSVSKATGIQHDVDHIVPLRGRGVCGMHVHWNLRVITHIENVRKSNKLIAEAA